MCRSLPITLLFATLGLVIPATTQAQIPVAAVIQAGVKKAIRAVDLKVQRLQNKTIALQNAQKVLENQLSALNLAEIASWVEKQKDLYQTYYASLWQVKSIIGYAHRVHRIADMESAIAREYTRDWEEASTDPGFTPAERGYMHRVYAGVLDQAATHADELMGVVKAFTTQMNDADRLREIDRVATAVQRNYDDIRRFRTQNRVLSLARAGDHRDAESIRQLYGLQ